MKTVTVEQFLSFHPCYSPARIHGFAIRHGRTEWSALNILRLSHVPAKDRLWAVLREELIDAPILHEFACRCAEQALKLIVNPDPRSVAAISAKRAWVQGEISNVELDAAVDAAWDAARDAAWDAAWDAAVAAAGAAAMATAGAAAGAAQVKMLIGMLEESEC